MTAKQFLNSSTAPDGSQYITLTDGNGNLVSLTALGIESATSLALGGATIGTDALAVTGTTTFNGDVKLNTQKIYFASASAIRSPSDGNILLQDSTLATFGRLQFGGTASSFPSLKRNATTIEFRLADDSAYSGANVSNISFPTNGGVIRDATGDGVLTLLDSALTSFKRLQFGGTTSSFPSIKRNGAGINFRLADDSADASITTLAINASGVITAWTNTATPAGGTTGTGYTFGTTANLGIFFGSGAPTLSAAQGSLYIRSDGSSTSTRLYVNTNGSTTWTAVTTVA